MQIVEKHLPTNCYSTKALYPKGIVLHHISAKNINLNQRYDNDLIYKIFVDYKVSAHYMILRDGTVWELVPPTNQAWHAGKSKFRGESGLNHTFLGIEFVGSDLDDFTEAQYDAGGRLIKQLMEKYKIPSHMITMHRIASTHKVRSDPKLDPSDRFDWVKLSHYIQNTTIFNSFL